MRDKIKYRSGYKYQLAVTYVIATGIIPNHSYEGQFLEIDLSGLLTIKPGYAWDGCSGPTVDRKCNMRAGLVHDALAQLIRAGVISKANYHKTNILFQRILKEDGMSWFFRQLYFKGVDTKIAARIATGKPRPVRVAP